MDFLTLAKARYSVRDYEDRAIEEEKLQKILEAGLLAPTAKNSQAHRVYVLKSPEALEKIRTLTRCAFNAPVVLLFTYNKEEEYRNKIEPDYTSGQQDASIVAAHMMLEAAELGLGSCWVNVFPPSDTMKAFDLPENERPVLLMPMGYASPDSVPSERHTQSREAKELIRFL
ncbi:MAG: nitroreductase family protein [Clostridiales bacterium]|nr:nitroreductase family protein [Clostridiales bacterium]MCD8155605.1 nitroreductase family protein [Clostridiales bacterium]